MVRKERCESGRIGLTANELTWETGSEGSNPSLSAQNSLRSVAFGITEGAGMAVTRAFGCVATFRIRPDGSLAALGGAG